MYIELGVDDWATPQENALQAFELDELLKHAVYSENRLRWRVKAYARLAGVNWAMVYFSTVAPDGTNLGDHARGRTDTMIDEVVKLYEWAESAHQYDEKVVYAWLSENWRGTNFDDLDGVLDNFFQCFEYHADFARELVSDGLIEGPGEEFEDYVDWDAKGEDIAGGYNEIEYEGVFYLFH